MLKKLVNQVSLVFQLTYQNKESKEYQKKYEKINQRLHDTPEILEAAHTDLKHMCTPKGKESSFTSEMILRMLLVNCIEMLSWRGTVARIDNDMVLRNFIGAGMCGNFPSFGYLCGANKFIREETWKKINNLLLHDCIDQEIVSGEKLRVDTTLYETNIHYPTDSHLLWDSYNVLTSSIREFKGLFSSIHLGNRFHNKKVKKHFTFIARNANCKSKQTKRTVKKRYNQLMDQVKRACQVSRECIIMVENPDKVAPLQQMMHYLPIVEKVLHQTDSRINHDIVLPAKEKVYSIYEEHTELIKRGKAGKLNEFGHMVMIAQTGEKFITDYKVMEVKEDDTKLVAPLLKNHKQQFGAFPDKFAGDKGFHESVTKTTELEKNIKLVCIPKLGKRSKAQELKEHSEEFKEMQRFRAGSEGSISTLKRAFGMRRCLLRSYKTFAASVGCIAFCYNLVLLNSM